MGQQLHDINIAYLHLSKVLLAVSKKGDHDKIGDFIRTTLKADKFELLKMCPHYSLLSREERLLVITYAYLYVALKEEDLILSTALAEVRCMLGITFEFTGCFMDYFAKANATYFEDKDPIALIMYPPDELREAIDTFILASIENDALFQNLPMAGLHRSDYQHDSDIDGRNIIEGTAGLEVVTKIVNEYALDKIKVAMTIGAHIKVNRENFPELYDLFLEACSILGIEKTPSLYIKPGFIGGDTVGVSTNCISIQSGSLSLLNRDELLFLIGHELGHIQCEHILYQQIGSVIPQLADAAGAMTLGFGKIAGYPVQAAIMAWMRNAEYSADRAGLLVCQNIEAAINVLMKAAGYPMKMYSKIDYEDFLKQAEEFKRWENSEDLNKIFKYFANMYGTHPWTVLRAAELMKWFKEGTFKSIRDNAIDYHKDCKTEKQTESDNTQFNLYEFAMNYFKDIQNGFYGKSVYFLENIPKEKLNNASSAYTTAEFLNEKAIMLYDGTFWGSADKGFILTDKALYASDISFKRVPFESIKGVYFINSNLYIEIERNNNIKQYEIGIVYSEKKLLFVTAIFNIVRSDYIKKSSSYLDLCAINSEYIEIRSLADQIEDNPSLLPQVIEYYRHLANSGNVLANADLGWLGMVYQGCITDDEIVENLLKSANYYHASSCINLALYYHGKDNFSYSGLWACIGALAGNACCMTFLGSHYLYNWGAFENNSSVAFEIYKIASEYNDPGALHMLAECLENGWGTDKDVEKANYYKRLERLSNS